MTSTLLRVKTHVPSLFLCPLFALKDCPVQPDSCPQPSFHLVPYEYSSRQWTVMSAFLAAVLVCLSAFLERWNFGAIVDQEWRVAGPKEQLKGDFAQSIHFIFYRSNQYRSRVFLMQLWWTLWKNNFQMPGSMWMIVQPISTEYEMWCLLKRLQQCGSSLFIFKLENTCNFLVLKMAGILHIEKALLERRQINSRLHQPFIVGALFVNG